LRTKGSKGGNIRGGGWQKKSSLRGEKESQNETYPTRMNEREKKKMTGGKNQLADLPKRKSKQESVAEEEGERGVIYEKRSLDQKRTAPQGGNKANSQT